MRKKIALLIPLFVIGLGVLSLSVVSAAGDSYKDAKELYEKSKKRSSLHKRTQGMAKLAASNDPEAIKELGKRYKKPENENPTGGPESEKGAPQAEHIRYIIADLIGRMFDRSENLTKEHIDEALKLAKANRKNQDAWLFYNAWYGAIKQGQVEEAIKEFERNSNEFFKAAILEAFGRNKNAAILPAMTAYLSEGKLSRKFTEREVMLRSSAAALLGAFKIVDTEIFKNAGYALMDRMVEEATPLETKLVISRTLGAIYGVKKRYTDARFWRQRIGSGIVSSDDGADGAKDEGGTKVRFMGVEASGKRVVFVIDFSDSMLTPLSEAEKETIEKPISGDSAKKKEDEKKKDDLPWDKIKNRFDLAREYLKLAINGLEEDVVFMVVWFGDTKGSFKSTDGLVQATSENKKAAISELFRIKPNATATSQIRPYGTLKGKTNLHGGLLTAFKAYGPRSDGKKFKGKSGFVTDFEHVDETTYEFGADTIFVLSDGAQSYDDWPAKDNRDPEDSAGDPETGTKTANQPVLLYWGPYVWANFLIRDVMRMNLWRDVEIHCIAIGEADTRVLDGIAYQGLGTVTKMGAEKPKEEGK